MKSFLAQIHLLKRCGYIRIALLFLFFLPTAIWNQTNGNAPGVDDLFLIARTKAFSGDRAGARIILNSILERLPNYHDVRILLGRTYAWDGKYDSARAAFNVVLKSNPADQDAASALSDTELWDEKFVAALDAASRALHYHPNDDALLVRKARAEKNLGREQDAVKSLLQAEEINPSNKDAIRLRQQLVLQSMLYTVGVNYTLDWFSSTYDPMHLAYLQLSRGTPYGTVIGRINYGNRFKKAGLQGEFDWYPRIADGMYGYLNYGFSDAAIFPKHRFGAEVYHKLPSSMEGSLGLRYLFFGANSTVTIYTGSLAWYYGNYYFSLRPYITPGNGNYSRSLSLLVRRYFGDADEYIAAKGGFGFSPDERSVILSTGENGRETYFLKSQNVGLGWQYPFTSFYLFVTTFDITHQELSFSPGEYTYDYSFSIGVRRRL
jgi:YaiO family outer membrane protein